MTKEIPILILNWLFIVKNLFLYSAEYENKTMPTAFSPDARGTSARSKRLKSDYQQDMLSKLFDWALVRQLMLVRRL